VIFVLDASAMIAFLRDEPGASVASEARIDSESKCHAHALNLCEVFYDVHRASGSQEALQAITDLVHIGVVEGTNLSSGVWQAAGTFERQSSPSLLGRLLRN